MLSIIHLLIVLSGSIVAGAPTRRTNFCYKNSTQPTRCLYLSQPTFLELELPYKTVALPEYIPGLKITGDEITRYSQRWLAVKKILPKCWPDLQVALTSILMPQCDEDSTTGYATKIYQPSHDICNDLVNRNNCQFLERHYGWLPMFNCSDFNLYNRNCTNNLRELKSYPTTTITSYSDSCKYPLIPSNDSKVWFKDVQGCAMHCKYPIINPQDHYSISTIIALFGMMGLISTGLAVLLYVVNNRKASRMAEVTGQCSLCQLMVYLGWLMQFVYNQDIACGSNGSSLNGASRLCVVTFFLTYTPSLASLLWCAYLAKLCFEKLTGVKKEDSKGPARIDKNTYLFCYGAPLSLFIIVSLLGEIEGYGPYGICTVGQQSNIMSKFVFLHVPTVIGVLYENFYFLRTTYKLRILKDKNQRLQRNLTRIIALALLSTVHLISSIGRHIYELKNHDPLVESVDRYLACSLNLDKVNEYDYADYSMLQSDCTINTKPMTMIYYIELISTLTMGTVIASWAFCEANFRSLRRKLVELLQDDKDSKFNQRTNSGGESEETYQHVTTPNGRTGARDVELAENVNHTAHQNCLDTEDSLASTSIDKYLPPRGTMKALKNKRRISRLTQKTSRDVINDQRQLQQQQFAFASGVGGNHFHPAMPAQPMPTAIDYSLVMPLLLQLLVQPGQKPGGAAAAAATTAAPVNGNSQPMPFNRPPWAKDNKSEKPAFDFMHATAQRPSRNGTDDEN